MSIPAVPIRTPMYDSKGAIARPWVAFFEGLGGSSTPSVAKNSAVVDIAVDAAGGFTPDLSKGTSFRVLLTADAPIDLPINSTADAAIDWTLELDQDSTGGHTATLDPGYNADYSLNSAASPGSTRSVVSLTTDQNGKTYPNATPSVDQRIPA